MFKRLVGKKEYKALERRVSILEAKLRNIESESAKAEKAEAAVAATSSAAPSSRKKSKKAVAAVTPDDLKVIKGIGKVIEEKLNAIGILTYEHLSKLTDAQIDALDDAVGSFRGRIERDDWKGQALEWAKKKK